MDKTYYENFWNNIYFTIIWASDNSENWRNKCVNCSKKILYYFLDLPEEDKAYLTIGKYLKEAGIKNIKIREEVLSHYRGFLEEKAHDRDSVKLAKGENYGICI